MKYIGLIRDCCGPPPRTPYGVSALLKKAQDGLPFQARACSSDAPEVIHQSGDSLEEQPGSQYCRHCEAVQRTCEFLEGGVRVLRCQVCRFPFGTSCPVKLQASPDTAGSRRIKILCVNDAPLTRQMIGDILRAEGYTVVMAPDGETGLGAVTRERPDLVLLDIMMPGLDGFEVCRLLKMDAATRDIPIIILTVLTDPKLNTRAFEAGAVLALQKTAEPRIILRTVAVALASAGPR